MEDQLQKELQSLIDLARMYSEVDDRDEGPSYYYALKADLHEAVKRYDEAKNCSERGR